MANTKPYNCFHGHIDIPECKKPKLESSFNAHNISIPENILRQGQSISFFQRMEIIINDCIFLEHQFINDRDEHRPPAPGEVRATLKKLKTQTKPFHKRLSVAQRIDRAEAIYILIIRLDKITQTSLRYAFGRHFHKELKSFKCAYKYLALTKSVNKLQILEGFISKIHQACIIALPKIPKQKGGRSSTKIDLVKQVISFVDTAFTDFNLPIKKTKDNFYFETINYVLIEMGLYNNESVISRAMFNS